LRVDLETGIAEDGWGGRDTLIGSFRTVHGNGQDDWFKGNAGDNFFWGNGGHDTFFGGAGTMAWPSAGSSPRHGRALASTPARRAAIQVSVDGREASVAPKTGMGFRYTLTDVEYVQADVDGEQWAQISLADFITPVEMAEQAIAAGGSQRWNAPALGTPGRAELQLRHPAPPAASVRRASAPSRRPSSSWCAISWPAPRLLRPELHRGHGSRQQRRPAALRRQPATDTRGVSWLPNQSGAGDNAGDVWMDVESMNGIVPGSEGYAALLHEIGHALGCATRATSIRAMRGRCSCARPTTAAR
jgi:hypothetical protein